MRFLVCLLFAGLCHAQPQWQVGGAIGYGVYRNGTIISPEGKVSAGVRNRFAASFWFTEDRFEHVSGELRYTYQDGDPFLKAGGVQTNLQGQSHTVHYDVLFHLRPLESRWRPYVSMGAGVKVYRISGPPNLSQPFQQIGTLTGKDEAKFVTVPGAGVIYTVVRGLVVRFDIRDYITTFPKRVIAPVPGATGRGLFQQVTPMIGIGYAF